MRYLYRGKRVDNGEWFLGNLATFKDGDCAIFDADDDTSPLCQVDPETVGQYIGINDINDKKIFEGDIVKHFNNDVFPNEFDVGVIHFNIEILAFMRTSKKLKKHKYFIYSNIKLEVIGNIYDDPELLKEVTRNNTF